MGIYINPPSGTKEEYLKKYGRAIPREAASAFDVDKQRNTALVGLVDNGLFTAAGVAFSNRERDYFLDPRDTRPQLWFLVPVDMLDEQAGLSRNFPQEYQDKSAWGIED